jgi:hypothetical protein
LLSEVRIEWEPKSCAADELPWQTTELSADSHNGLVVIARELIELLQNRRLGATSFPAEASRLSECNRPTMTF